MRKDDCNLGYGVESTCRAAPPKRLGPQGSAPWHYPARNASREATTANPHSVDRRDLCCICTYAEECMYRSAPGEAKLHCELFDVEVRAFAACERAVAPQHDCGGDEEPIGGLCSNCDHHMHCTIRSKEGTVWHCEEYV